MRSGSPILHRRHARGHARMLALTGLLAVAALAAAPLAATAATPYGINLVKNPGAQIGLTNWDVDGDFGTQAYGASGLGFPSTSASASIGGGTRFFWGGPSEANSDLCGDANQEFALTGLGSAIDSGHVKVRLRGYAGTNGAADLNAHLDLYFRTANNHSVASNGIENTATSTNEQYVRFDVTKTLSRSTRLLRLHLWVDGEGTTGGCQGFWDKLSVVLIAS